MALVDQRPLLKNGTAITAETLAWIIFARDLVLTPGFVAWYLALALLVEQPAALGYAPPPAAALGLQALLAAAAVVVYWLHLVAPAPPPDETEVVQMLSRCGRWVMLTRHCVALQTAHLLLSVAGSGLGSARLVRLTEGMAVWIGALGFYVTVQFFTLVFPNPEFQERCERAMKRDPPTNLRRMASLNHAPAAVLAALDVALAKGRAAMRAECSLAATLGLAALYVLLYLLLIVANHRATGCWPYPFLKAFGLGKWVIFVIVQTAIFIGFVLLVWSLLFLPLGWGTERPR